VNKYSNLKGEILRRESKIDTCQKSLVKLDQDCAELDDLLAHKNSRLSQVIKEQAEQKEHLNQIIDNQEEIYDQKNQNIIALAQAIQNQQFKNNQKQKQIILLSQQLATDQTKIKDLTELLTKTEKEVKNLTKQLTKTQQKLTRTKTYQQNRIQNLEAQNKALLSFNKDLKIKLVYYEDQDKKLRNTIQDLQSQINNHVCSTSHTCSPCPLIHLPEPHTCPNKFSCSHSDYSEIKEQNDNYQQQLDRKELEIVQLLNTAFKLGLNKNEKDLSKVIVEISKLIDKPPLTITDEAIKQELVQAQQTITKLEQELQTKTIGENIKEIIKIDEKLLNKNANLKIELNQQTQDYQQLAQERNKLVLQQIKDINVVKLQQLIPKLEKQTIQQNLQKAKNYEELSQERNKMIVKYLNQNTQQKLANPESLPQNNHSERVI